MKDHHGHANTPFVSEFVEKQYHRCSQPINVPIWSGIFKISGKGFLSLAAHLSTMACKKVWDVSRSLLPVLEVTKLSRSEAWPTSWDASRPTEDSIGLYFLPQNMRQNEDLDQLVKEVIESDVVLYAVVGIAELLIFPSILLPEQYHMFQRKHYLWGVFKRRSARCDEGVLVEEQDGTAKCAEVDMQEQRVLSQKVEVKCEESDQGISLVNHAMHLEKQQSKYMHHGAEKESPEASTREGTNLASNGKSSAKTS